MFDWTQINRSPIANEVRQAVASELRRIRRPRVRDRMRVVEEFVTNRSVLDIGVVEHALEHANAERWLHAHIVRWARSVLGVDILAPEVGELCRRGYDIVVADATSDADIGRRFERVMLGDIIEHVNDPVALLRFAKRHLSVGGLVMVSTPNPLYYAWIYESLRTGVVTANAEHIGWVGPSMALELGRRAGLDLVEYRLLAPLPERDTWRTRALRRVTDGLLPEAELFAGWFVYVYASPAEGPRAPT